MWCYILYIPCNIVHTFIYIIIHTFDTILAFTGTKNTSAILEFKHLPARL